MYAWVVVKLRDINRHRSCNSVFVVCFFGRLIVCFISKVSKRLGSFVFIILNMRYLMFSSSVFNYDCLSISFGVV